MIYTEKLVNLANTYIHLVDQGGQVDRAVLEHQVDAVLQRAHRHFLRN